jgi:hypothetical protein
MGYLAGINAAIYRYTRDGRRLYLRLGLTGRRHYLVSDAATAMLERRLRRYQIACLSLIAVTGWLVARLDSLWVFVFPAVCPLLARPWLTRGLPSVHVSAAEIQCPDANAQSLATARAFGAPTLWLMLLATAAMGALGAFVGIMDRYWVGWVLFVLMVVAAWQMARQIRILSHDADSGVTLRRD